MENFKLLRLFSIVFKILAWGVLVLMGTGLAGLFVARNEPGVHFTGPVALNMIFSGVVAFLFFYAFGEVIRLLLTLLDHLVKRE